MMERYSVEILQEAKRVYLVTTAELPALHLCREKLNFLRSQDLDGRVSILLNRAQKRGQISTAEMEKLFGMPVQMDIPERLRGRACGAHGGQGGGRILRARRPLPRTGRYHGPKESSRRR